MKIKRQTLNQSGVSAVEFTLLLPVLLIILFGMIEFSVLFYDKAIITNASREGARTGVVYAYTEGCEDTSCHAADQDIRDAVNFYSANMLISFDGNQTVSTDIDRTAGDAPGAPLRVTVQYQYDWLILPDFVSSLLGGPLLTAETVMRLE